MSILDSSEALLLAGFRGFVTVGALRESRNRDVPDLRGVYLVLGNSSDAPTFLSISVGGRLAGIDPTVPIAELERNWVPSAVVLYIGQAGGGTSKERLRRRIRTLMRFGAGRRAAHRGGRLIWQLADHEELKVCWRASSDRVALDEERDLLCQFEEAHGSSHLDRLGEIAQGEATF